MQGLLNTPAIAAAMITGIIAIVATIIQSILTLTKYSFDTKTNFEKTLKEKLENVYSPLIILISDTKENSILLTDPVMKLINQYGYLLSTELINDIRELHKIEIDDWTSKEFKRTFAEFKNLKNRVIDRINNEFDELQSLYNKNFIEYQKRFSMPWYFKFIAVLKRICLITTLIFWTIFWGTQIISSIEPVPKLLNNNIANTIATFLLLIIIVTSLTLAFYLVIFILGKIDKRIGKLRRLYPPHETVTQTGIYQCRICGEIKTFYKNGVFPFCTEEFKWSRLLKVIWYQRIWALKSTELTNNHEINSISK